jgi:AraC-like DNA-binding protein
VRPAEFVESARVDAARVMLENSVDPLKTIAYKCGLRDATSCALFSEGGWASRRSSTGLTSVLPGARHL